MDEQESEETNAVSDDEMALLQKEQEVLETTLQSLAEQSSHRAELLRAEDKRSRTLTAELVAATRDEDKQMLASDEAVSHALKQNHSGEQKNLTRLLEKPYFARFVIEEEKNGRLHTFEYKLGYSSNPDCRIIDWRKSPLSKIYYEYQEGEEFCEEIQGTEREGTITLRHPVRIDKGELKSVTTRFGTFSLQNGKWERSGRKAQGRGGIKSVLPLITAEQFKTITEDAKTAVLIQGIAGSGKTTVALHRLAWLLHENNSEFGPDETGVIVRNEVLAEFIRHTLEAIEIENVPIFTFEEWKTKLFQEYEPTLQIDERGVAAPPPKGLTLFLHSEQYFRLLEQELQKSTTSAANGTPLVEQFWNLMNAVFQQAALEHTGSFRTCGVEPDKVRSFFELSKTNGTIPSSFTDSYLRVLIGAHIHHNPQPAPPLRFKHLVVDELQDYSFVSLACLMNAVKETRDLTLVGDVGQALSHEHDFIGWERLKEVWDIDLGEHAKFFTLEVSHRSTLPIMRLASRVAERPLPTEGRQGRTPIWFHCAGEQSAFQSALGWLQKATERYPDLLSAVLCQDHEEAAQVYSLLQPTFGPIVRLGKGASFSFEEGLVVTTVEEVKGLEFANVLIWNPSAKALPRGERLAKNRLYVAMTRAEENLCLVTWGRYSGLLPSTRSKLVRGYDFRDELEETAERT